MRRSGGSRCRPTTAIRSSSGCSASRRGRGAAPRSGRSSTGRRATSTSSRRDARDLAVADLDAGVAQGFVSEATARDAATVRYSFLESMALSLLARSRGYFVLHAAGVVRGDRGIALQGPAGAGKSTLAMACARRGFGVFAEDSIFVRVRPTGLEWWGMPWVQRLLPDARPAVPGDRRAARPRPAERRIEDRRRARRIHPGRAVPCAAPGPIVLLSRGDGGPTRIERVEGGTSPTPRGPLAVGRRLVRRRTRRAPGRWATHGVFRLHVNGPPDEAVDALEALVDSLPASIRPGDARRSGDGQTG